MKIIKSPRKNTGKISKETKNNFQQYYLWFYVYHNSLMINNNLKRERKYK